MTTMWPVLADPAEPMVAPEVDTDVAEAIDTPWRVILFDDDVHTFEDVIVQLIKATGCSEAQAEAHAWTVHTTGKDCVYQGDFFECFRVQGVLREIQLVTEIEG
jgi:ATP-dependent Clp protease adaptor protein ClpS